MLKLIQYLDLLLKTRAAFVTAEFDGCQPANRGPPLTSNALRSFSLSTLLSTHLIAYTSSPPAWSHGSMNVMDHCSCQPRHVGRQLPSPGPCELLHTNPIPTAHVESRKITKEIGGYGPSSAHLSRLAHVERVLPVKWSVARNIICSAESRGYEKPNVAPRHGSCCTFGIFLTTRVTRNWRTRALQAPRNSEHMSLLAVTGVTHHATDRMRRSVLNPLKSQAAERYEGPFHAKAPTAQPPIECTNRTHSGYSAV